MLTRSPIDKPHALPRGFAPLFLAFFIAMLGTTLPTPLYPLYETRFHIAPVLTPVIFAIYAVAVIVGSLLFGHQSDRIGRKPILVPALVLSAISAIVFLCAHSLSMLLVGRVLSGLSAGMFTGTGTAALLDGAREDTRRLATNLANVANLGGLAAGLLLCGFLGQFAPDPLRITFAVDIALVVAATLWLLRIPERVRATDRRLRLQFAPLGVPPAIRATFIPATIAGMCGFAVSGLYSAIAPDLLVHLLHVPGPAIAGAVVFLVMAASAGAQFIVRYFPKNSAFTVGCVTLAVGLVALVAVIFGHALALIFVSAILCGTGQGLVIGFGLANINERVDPSLRGTVTSTYFVWLYIALALPVVGVGYLAHGIGLPVAGTIFCATVGVIALAAALALGRTTLPSAASP